ncbi:MmgE/PrpD family protein [Mycobacterium sp.]|uniref:MmgE/PrpD family protein n=1 Tax=Mycobacterium sp. TaxID=1785 RepID=UPI003BB10854
MSGLTIGLAKRSATLSFDQLPDDVIAMARLCVLDWLGVTLAGSHEPAARILLQTLAPSAVEDGASVFGHAIRVSPRQAALINGTSSHVLDFDDVNATLIGHPSVAILGAVLALAESLHSSGPEFLCAFVAGYETACRVAAAVGPVSYLRGFHHTGTIGTLGAAAACARLLSLDADRTATALALAATQAAGLGCMVGTMAKSFHAGKACENGMLAALLARNGFTATESAVECAKGFAATTSGECDAAAALGEPPMGWHILNNLFKFDASCYMTHSTLAGIRDLRTEHQFNAEHIAEIRVHLGELEYATCALPSPATGLEVKFSVAHLAAMAALGRSTMVIDDAAAHDPATVALRDKVIVTSDGTSGAPTHVEVTLNDGRQLATARDVNTPESDLALQRRRLEEKFRIITTPHLGADRAEAVVTSVQTSAAALDVRGISELTRH